jgi:hypothetical protein
MILLIDFLEDPLRDDIGSSIKPESETFNFNSNVVPLKGSDPGV